MPTKLTLTKETTCPFCAIPKKRNRRIWVETGHWFAITPKYAARRTHTLLIPKRHVAALDELNLYEVSALPEALRKTLANIASRTPLDGYNLGVNCGAAAGQTISHLHIHLIPRFQGDVPDPRGGIIRPLAALFPESRFEAYLH